MNNPHSNYWYRGNHPKSTLDLLAWHAKAAIPIALEPELPILDCHHHLFGNREDRLFYQMSDLRRDLNSGHRILATVYVEAYESGWYKSGPITLRPVGEVEMIAACTETPLETDFGTCDVAAAIVGTADLTLGPAVAEVLAAEAAVGQGRLRSIRYRVAWDGGSISEVIHDQPKPHLLIDPRLQQGVAAVGAAGLCFETWVYHTQIDELVALANACPDVKIVTCHLSSPIGIGEYSAHRDEVFKEWERGMRRLAERPNILVKLGGLGMPLFGFEFDEQPQPAKAAELVAVWRRYLDVTIQAFGTARCMFESNFPVDKQSCSYVELWNAFKLFTHGWSVHERADLFYRTACRTYALPDIQARGDRAMGLNR